MCTVLAEGALEGVLFGSVGFVADRAGVDRPGLGHWSERRRKSSRMKKGNKERREERMTEYKNVKPVKK